MGHLPCCPAIRAPRRRSVVNREAAGVCSRDRDAVVTTLSSVTSGRVAFAAQGLDADLQARAGVDGPSPGAQAGRAGFVVLQLLRHRGTTCLQHKPISGGRSAHVHGDREDHSIRRVSIGARSRRHDVCRRLRQGWRCAHSRTAGGVGHGRGAAAHPGSVHPAACTSKASPTASRWTSSPAVPTSPAPSWTCLWKAGVWTSPFWSSGTVIGP